MGKKNDKKDADKLQQKNVQQVLEEYGQTFNRKDRRLSNKKKIIIIISAVTAAVAISAFVAYKLISRTRYIYPFVDYNIEQLADDSIKIKEDSTIGDLTIIDVPGYRFDGWYKDAEMTEKYEDSDKLQDKVTIYAKYIQINQISLTIDNVTTAISYESGRTLDEILAAENIDINDFNSCGWFTDADLITPFDNVLIDKLHLHTKTATLDKLDFSVADENGNYLASLKDTVDASSVGNLVMPRKNENGSVIGFQLQNCTIANLTIPATITEIASHSLNNSTIGGINLTYSITKLNDSAFENTNIHYLALSSSISEIGYSAFKNSGIEELAINNLHITTIKASTFEGCENLKAIDLSTCESLATIEEKSFDNCSSLKTLSLPKSIVNIDFETFKTCTILSKISVDSNNPIYDSRDNCNAIISKTAITKTVGPDVVTIAENTLLLGCVGTVIPTSVRVIATSAFSNHAGIQTIIVPNGVVTIEPYAFSNCSNLQQVLIADSVTTIGNATFKTCVNLIDITLPRYLEVLSEELFADCSNLTSFIIPESINTIEAKAFASTGLSSIHIPEAVASIDVSAFSKCNSLNIITVADNNSVYNSGENSNAIIETATNTLYIGCPTTIIPTSVVTIGVSAFRDCVGLTQITIPSNVKTIERTAFAGCTGLTFIELPIEVEKIGANAFVDCANLESVTIPSTVTKVVYYKDPVTGQTLMKTITTEGKGSWYLVDNAEDWNNLANGTKLEDVSDPIKNAEMLKEVYANDYWYKYEETYE